MFDLSRVEYPDLLWGADELDDVAALWLAWHEQAQLGVIRRLESYYAVQLKLWAFPRQDRNMLRQRLQQKLNSMGVVSSEIDDSDPEWVGLVPKGDGQGL